MDRHKLCVCILVTCVSYCVAASESSDVDEFEQIVNAVGPSSTLPSRTIVDRLFLFPTDSCSDKYEIKTGHIIRTEDSLKNGASFVDAVVAISYDDCLEQCCSTNIGLGLCDTSVYIEGGSVSEEENCFLFRCWFDDDKDMRCLFSKHEGYISSMDGGFDLIRFSHPQMVDPPTQRIQSDELLKPVDEGVVSTNMPPMPTRKPTTVLFVPTTKVPSTFKESDIPEPEVTPAPSKHEYEFVCISTQYQCPVSRECIPTRLICDKIVDCKDETDEEGCQNGKIDHIDKLHHSQEDDYYIRGPVVSRTVSPILQQQEHNGGGYQNTLSPPNSPAPSRPDKENTNQDSISTGGEDQIEKADKPSSKAGNDSKASKSNGVAEAERTMEVATGALFPLVVGLLLTVVLLMLVGCRVRFMNRRLRYGRTKNRAHDADYLINGMYL